VDVIRSSSVGDFLALTEEFLAEREAEHNLIFGVASNLRDDPSQFTGPAYLATVHDDDRVIAVALRTPPFRLVLSEIDDARAVDVIARDTLDLDLPGAQGPVDIVRAFVAARHSAGGPAAKRQLGERIYRLREVVPPRPVPGVARPARPTDRDLVAQWVYDFEFEALGEDDRPAAEAAADNWIAGRGRTLFLWDVDGEAVSMTGVGGPTPHGIRIGTVYTPPDRRGRGYASALVAAVSQAQLDSGKTFVFLFTDLANPTSNRIYQAIGYEPVTDFDVYLFETG